VFRTDNVLEYVKKDVSIFCSKNEIIQQTSYSHTSQQNGVVERKHRHILDVSRTMMIYISILKYLWSDAMLSACHLINRMLSYVLDKISPFSCLYPNKTPFSMTPRIFGCTCFIQDLSRGLDKLSPRSIKYVFVGYYKTQKSFQCYNPSTKKYLVPVDVMFFESILYFSPQVPVTITETVPPSLSVPLSTHVSTISLPVLPVETPNPPVSKPVQDSRYVYTHRPKVPASEPVPTKPSLVDGPPSPPSASSSDLDIHIALRKGKQSCTDYPISNFIFNDHLNPTFH